MSVMDMNSRMAMAEKLSVQQLQQAVQSGSLPAYIGIPLIEQKTKERAQMAAAQQGQQKPPSVVASILQQADQQEQQEQGIDQLPSNLPTEQDEEMGMAGGGIIAFAKGGGTDMSKMPTADLTEAEFNALPPEARARRIEQMRDESLFSADTRTGYLNALPAAPAFVGAAATTPFLAGARAVLPESINQKLPTVGDLYGDKGVSGIFKRAVAKGKEAGAKDAEARILANARTHDPVAEGASPSAQNLEEDPLITALLQDPLAQFSGLTPETLTADTARIEKIKADRAAAEEKQRREFLSRSAPHMLPPEAPSAIGEMQDPGGAAVAGIGIPVRGNRPGTGQGTQGAGNAPTARQAAPTAQAPAAQASTAQPEGQSALDKYAAMLMAEREGSGKERDKAKGMAILQAGLGIMGGTSPNAFANIAQGALPATQAYQQSIKGIRAEDAARLKELMGLGISKEKLALEAKKLGISEKRFDQMYQLETQKIGIMGGSRADAAQNSEALRRDQLAKGYFELLLKQNPMATESEQDALRDRARAFAARDAGGTAPSSTNKYAGFSIVK